MSQYSFEQDYKFIGRENEIQLFTHWVNDPTQPQLFFIHDTATQKNEQGGIGKTRLLRELYGMIEKDHPQIIPVLIDFFSPEDRDGITIARRVISALQHHYRQWSFAAFELALEEYRRTVQSRSADSAAQREQLLQTLFLDLEHMRERMNGEQKSVLLFFDTFERIEDNPAVAVLNAKQHFPDNYQSNLVRAVIAGRNTPRWSHRVWQGREQDVLLCPLAGFSLPEAREYLVENAPTSVALGEQPAETIQALHMLTGGRPILLALLVDILNHPEIQLTNILEMSRHRLEETLVQLLHLIKPIDSVIYFMAHISHRFDVQILEAVASTIEMLQSSDLASSFTKVAQLSVVRTSSSQHDVLVLHDEMRRMVNDYCWPREDPTRKIRSDLSKLMIKHYDARLAVPLEEELRESYLVEKLFHELYLDIETGLASFTDQFVQALWLSQRAFARSLLQEVKRFDEERMRSHEKQPQLSPAQREDLRLAEARLFVAEENPQAALLVYQELEGDPNSSWAQDNLSDLLFFKGDCYFHTAQHAEAIASFEACLRLEQKNSDQTRTADIYNALGLIARRQARYHEARDYFLLSLDLSKSLGSRIRYAIASNHLGNVYRVMGEPETGLLYCKRGLQENERLYEERRISRILVGSSHIVLGHVYHALERLAEEELHYQKAFEIFEALGLRFYLAQGYIGLGRVCVVKNDLDQAFAYFTQAHGLAQGINREAEVESLNQLGRIFRRREQWAEAAEKFTEAVERSRTLRRPFALAENLMYLADVLDHMGQPIQAQLEEARQVAPNKLMQGRIEEIQGDIYYRYGQYQAAFERYAECCKLTTQHGEVDFYKVLRKLENCLLETPEDVLPPILSFLLNYWADNHLDEKYPDFSAVCRLVQRL